MGLRAVFPEIPPNERARFAYAACGFVCVAGSALVARAAGDAIFLSRFSAEFLPFMYIGSALVIIAAGYACGAIGRRMAQARVVMGAAALLIALILVLRALLETPYGPVRAACYFLADLVINLPLMLFWGFAGVVFNPREGKRLFGLIGAAGTAGCITLGFLIRPLATRVGTENLLLLVAALIAGLWLSVQRLSRHEARHTRPVETPRGQSSVASRAGYMSSLLRSPQVRNVAFLVFVATILLVIVDFNFKVAARERYVGAELAGFMGTFYAFANILALVLQLFFVHHILRRASVLGSLTILPLGLAVTVAGTAATGGFGWILATKVLDPVFNFTINSAAVQMLFMAVKKQTRGQARTLVDGVFKPLAMALTGAMLVAGGAAGPIRTLCFGMAGVLVVWFVLVWRNHAAYIRGLAVSTGAMRLEETHENLAYADKTLDALARKELLEARSDIVPSLLAVLQETWNLRPTAEVRILLARPEGNVKAASLDYLGKYGTEDDRPAVAVHATHAEPLVRAAALRAMGGWTTEQAFNILMKGLNDADPVVRATAAVELTGFGDLDGLLAAGVALKSMLQSEDAEQRLAASEALHHLNTAGMTRVLVTLLSDGDRRVRASALEACALQPNERLIPVILPILNEPGIGATAASALTAFGAMAVAPLAELLDKGRNETASRGLCRVPGILAEIGAEEGLPVLERALDAPDASLRRQVVTAYCRLLKHLPSGQSHKGVVEKALKSEVEHAALLAAAPGTARGMPHGEVLCRALEDEFKEHLRNAFSLLDVLVGRVDMNALYLRLSRDKDDRRAEALELLDNVLPDALKPLLMPLVEPARAAAPGGAGGAGGAEASRASMAQADALIAHVLGRAHAEWAKVGALYAVAENGLRAHLAAVRALLRDPSAPVRETALYAASRIDERAAVLEHCTMGARDPDAAVRTLAEAIAGGGNKEQKQKQIKS